MPNSRSRSRSPRPRREERPRSRSSPRRRRVDDEPRQRGGGFKWKEKRRDEDLQDRNASKTLERGYRGIDKDHRPRSPVRDQERMDNDIQKSEGKPKKEKKERKEKKVGPVPTGEPMIIVNVNDRLGTKASIPCLASDSIKLFKAQVAAQIGRQPHEIMLKRQGERPFNDKLSLEDYGISNGVQIDLEIDTGD